jgi:uncharacterized protein (DUF885 family)
MKATSPSSPRVMPNIIDSVFYHGRGRTRRAAMALRPNGPAASLLALAFLAACGGEPTPVVGPPPLAPETVVPPPEPKPDAAFMYSRAFADHRDRIIAEWLAAEPSTGRALGFHEYDGKVEDVSAAALDSRVEQLKKTRTELESFDPKNLSDDDALDLKLLEQQIDFTLFGFTERDQVHKIPQFYESLFNVSNYVERDYAPVAERGAKLVEHEEAALGQVPHVVENLRLPLSKPIAEITAKNYAGFASYLRGDVAKMFAGVGDDAMKARFAKANSALAKEADRLAAFLKKAVATGDQSHVLGKEKYLKLLKAQEGLEISLEEFKKMGADNLALNKAAYEALLPKVKITRPAAKDLLETARQISRQARQFIVDKGVVALASQDDAEVRETPPYARWNSASIEMSGPFDKAQNAFYYVTLPDPKWSKKEQEGYVSTYGTLWSTTVHEVYPGHFVQLRWVDRAPSKVQKMVSSYSFVEGWAHYTEQMMMEQGFLPTLPAATKNGTVDAHVAGVDTDAIHIGQLSDALLRNCRYMASIGMHTEGMTVAQAKDMFMKQCHIDAKEAEEQAVRGTFDPGYFAYTLGKLQILKLRDEAKEKMGDKFTLERFHDALLSHGSPPVALIHERVLKDLAALK